eukprot:TRINITY_DN1221_c0_g1_i1.p1 TRINITY_DN1221_c0_g1~~TRINITY_DN1221_c0_g1_i1.p1  ORF type:complete len:313 (-),score=61.69 TRINITY_DN1221_c0_g1_i1:14-952(-)
MKVRRISLALGSFLASGHAGVEWTSLPEEALAFDDACAAGGACSLELLQSRGRSRSQQVVGLDWQGVRETGVTCMFSSCDAALGDTECYHLRCVCKEGLLYRKEDGKCVSRASAEGKREISPEDTGDTCYFSGCSGRHQRCEKNECICSEGYAYQGGECKLTGTALPPQPVEQHLRPEDGDARRIGPPPPPQPVAWEKDHSSATSSTSEAAPATPTTTAAEAPATTNSTSEAAPATPTTTEAPAATNSTSEEAPATTSAEAPSRTSEAAHSVNKVAAGVKAACAANTGCGRLGLTGTCCPNAQGVMLGCCDK